jgi:hypothetical protein
MAVFQVFMPHPFSAPIIFGRLDPLLRSMRTIDETTSRHAMCSSHALRPLRARKRVPAHLAGRKVFSQYRRSGSLALGQEAKWGFLCYPPGMNERSDKPLFAKDGANFLAVLTQTGETEWRANASVRLDEPHQILEQVVGTEIFTSEETARRWLYSMGEKRGFKKIDIIFEPLSGRRDSA